MPLDLKSAREQVRAHLTEWEASHFHGPCGPIAAVLQEAIGGDLYYCLTSSQPRPSVYDWYGHYVVRKDGEIFDIAGVFAEGAERAFYKDLQKHPERINQCWTDEDIDFWRGRLELK